MRPMSLAHLTAINLAPPALIRAAAQAGFDSVGLRLIAVNDVTPGYRLMDDPAALRATRAAMAETGVAVMDIEFVKITPDISVAGLEPMLAAGAALQARCLITAPYDPDHARLSDRLAAIAELAAGFGIRPILEFFPWTDVPDIAAARRVVEAAGDLPGILVDVLHFDRSGSRLADLDGLARRLPFFHLCDARRQPSYTTEELFFAGRVERLPPGAGDIDILSILGRLPPEIPAAVEVPMTALTREMGAPHVLRLVAEAARRILTADDDRRGGFMPLI